MSNKIGVININDRLLKNDVKNTKDILIGN